MNEFTELVIESCEAMSSYEKAIRKRTAEYVDDGSIQVVDQEDMVDFIDDIKSFTFQLAKYIKEKWNLDGYVDYLDLTIYFVKKYYPNLK